MSAPRRLRARLAGGLRDGLPGGLAGEILRFGLVSVAGLGIDLALAWGLAALAGVPLTLAAAAGFCAAAVLNYLLHEYWTFRDGAPQPSFGRALRYLGALALTLAVRLAAVAVLARLAGAAAAAPGPQLAILLAATGLSFVANYLASKVLVFRPAAGLKAGPEGRPEGPRGPAAAPVAPRTEAPALEKRP